MEGLGMKQFENIYSGKRVLVTGHSGFKGSWLSLWLTELGADVIGVSLAPETLPNHWDLLKLSVNEHRIDIREISKLTQVFKDTQPEIIFHLAAQPLVRRSYRDPLETWSTNVLGTANILEASRHSDSVQAVVVVTTDKCYENQEWIWGYRENDTLGGYDPYSASKACAEMVVSSFRSSFQRNGSKPLLATARAGNVIGGGDWSEDRLIPDLIRNIKSDHSLAIRSPNATRPWQHVLESLSGYLLLGKNLLSGIEHFASPWNFGPDPDGNRSVAEVLGKLNRFWSEVKWHTTLDPQPHEANLLYLDSAKARALLRWQPVWDLDQTLEKTVDWYRAWMTNKHVITREQLAGYLTSAQNMQIEWISE
jgi:CDP-glucose 4,6-dehydratase